MGISYEYNKKKIKLFLLGGGKKKKKNLYCTSPFPILNCVLRIETREPSFWLPVSSGLR